MEVLMERRAFEPGERVVVALAPVRDSILGWQERLRGTIVFAGYKDKWDWTGVQKIAEIPMYSVEIDIPRQGLGSAQVLHPAQDERVLECEVHSRVGQPLQILLTLADDPKQPTCIFPERFVIQEDFFGFPLT